MNIRFSIIIPAYNEAQYIAQCIKSVQKQIGNFKSEIIVVDNNSTDKTAEIASNLGVKVVLEKKQGVGSARKLGTEKAQGEIIIQLDSDTKLPENYLQKVDKYFIADKQLACLGGQFVFYDAPWWKNALRPFIFYLLLYITRLFSGGRMGTMGAGMCFRKNIYDKTNGFNTNLKFAEDADICRQLSYFGKVKIKPNLKCYISSRRFKFNWHLLVLFGHYLKMIFLGTNKANYNFPHSDEI